MIDWRGSFGRGLPEAAPGRWVVLDVESTGLDPRRDRLVAIAGVALRFDQGVPRVEASDSFEAVLQPATAAFDRENILVHGVGVGAQRRGHAQAAALQAFEHWAAGAPRTGFHVDFDRVLIERAMQAAGLRAAQSNVRWIDLAPLAAATHPGVRARALDEWLEHFGIPCLARHEAVADTLATAELLLRLWPALRGAGVKDAAGAQALARHQRWLQR
ncbi:MAG: exonuclease domain-containing protein [Rubrivivax sp.]